MAFKSPLLQSSPGLNQVMAGAPSIKVASTNVEAVKTIQKALRGVGYPMNVSFPNGFDQEPDGKFGQETYDAVLNLQQQRFKNDRTQWDGRVGPKTLTELDDLLAKGQPIPPGPNPAPPSGTCVPLDDSIPTGDEYASIPPEVMTVLQRSYRERSGENRNLLKGFEDDDKATCPQSKVTLKQVIDRLKNQTPFNVLLEIYNRCHDKAPSLWPKIRWIAEIYDFSTSRGIWVFIDPDNIVTARAEMQRNTNFCADMVVGHSTHQTYNNQSMPSQCYRELGRVSEAGLHVCLKAQNLGTGGWHNIHIDPHQIGSEKTKKCACWYAKTTNHFDDVGRWCVKWFVDNHKNDPKYRAACAVLGVDPEDTDQIYWVLMSVTGDYDTFVDMADNPMKYLYRDFKTAAVTELAMAYKAAYNEYMAPQYDP